LSSFNSELFLALPGASFGRPFFYFPKTDSTNQRLKEMEARNPSEGTLLLAEEQESGRGRWGRRWEAKLGQSLLFSLLLKPQQGSLGQLTPLVGLACAEALSLAGLGLKWPNDLYVDGKKLGGILLEGSPEYLIVGIGLNVSQEAGDFPEELRESATSLRLAGAPSLSREALLSKLLLSLEENYRSWKAEGFKSVQKRWNDKALYMNQEVSTGSIQGRLLGLAEDGGLLLERNEGIQKIVSGEIERLRPLLD
jgi:BirA family biotin operon repressor/biotin-[acetyl-CoA-carboxylase] ligase